MLNRTFLIIVASVLGVGLYAWFRMAYGMGVPILSDIPFVLFHVLLPVLILALLVGSFLLWIKTAHRAALIQFISCSITFAFAAVEEVASYLGPEAQLYEFIHRRDIQAPIQIVILLCFIAFPVAYICYAQTQKRI